MTFWTVFVLQQIPAMPKGKSVSQKTKERRELMDLYKIYFNGPVSPSDWPDGYKSIFSPVREIGRQEFDSYRTSGKGGRISVGEMKTRTIEINRVSKKDQISRFNEATLRGHTEPLVFARFSSEIKWYVIMASD
jgi:hypothetical protein